MHSTRTITYSLQTNQSIIHSRLNSNSVTTESPKSENPQLDAGIQISIPSALNPKSPIKFGVSPHPNPSPSEFGTHSPKSSHNPSPARKLQRVFQQETDRLEAEDRINSIFESIELELTRTGLDIDRSALAARL